MWLLKLHGMSLGIVIYMVLLMTITLGLSVGYQANSLEEATIDLDEVDIDASSSEVETDSPGPDWMSSSNDGEVNERFIPVVESVTFSALWVASLIAPIGYFMSFVMPEIVVNGILTIAAIAPVVYLTQRTASIARAALS